jgi:hypothetical protein
VLDSARFCVSCGADLAAADVPMPAAASLPGAASPRTEASATPLAPLAPVPPLANLAPFAPLPPTRHVLRNLMVIGVIGFIALVGVGGAILATGGAERLKPVQPVTFATIDQYPTDRRVAVIGRLELPSTLRCDTECGVYLVDIAGTDREIPLFITVAGIGATAAPNQMERVPARYETEDFRVRTSSTNATIYVGDDDILRVVGHLCRTEGDQPRLCIVAEELYEAAIGEP